MDWYENVKPYEDKLRENRASPEALHELAKVYFGGYLGVEGNSPKARLNGILADDAKLVEAVLCGFRKTVEWDDLPSDQQIIRLGTSNWTHPLALPFVAGLEEMTRTGPDDINLDEGLLRLALAIHYTVPMWPTVRPPEDRTPRWYSWSLSNRPDIVADVLVRSVLSKLRGGMQSPHALYELAHSQVYEPVARAAVMPLLKRFPVRCTSEQLSSLRHLLLAASRYCNIGRFRELIDKKLAHRNMTVAQHVHWLAAGLCIAPDTYADRLDSYVTGKERRIRFLAEAMTRQSDIFSDLEGPRRVSAMQLLIRLIGTSCRPYSYDGKSNKTVIVIPEVDAAERIRGFIEELAGISSKDASSALQALVSDSALNPWHSLLMDAACRQKVLRHEAEFVHGSVDQVLNTLDSGVPANAADLAALTLEHLRQIARNIRHGSTSGWRQYWNVDGHNRPQSPRPENACRDRLSSDLQAKLEQSGIDVVLEGHYANDKRADIRVSYAGFNIPVEIKRSCRVTQGLWSAVRSQLLARYSIDPGAEGHGIYVVFWFGDAEGCRRPMVSATGSPVMNARELEDHLVYGLSVEERCKIGICVIDVSIPDTG